MSREENESMIVSEFGGLNTTSTPDSMPLTDATHLVNVLPSIGGGLEKRPGSRLLYRDAFGRYGVSVASVTTARGYKFLVSKEGTSIRAYLSTTLGLFAAVQKNNVFSPEALKTRAQLTVLNDIPTRVLFLTGSNKPVQLQLAETVTQVTGAVAATSVVFDNAQIANGLNAQSIVLFKDRTLVSGTLGFSYNAVTGQLTVSNIPAYNGDATFELVVVTWQWWAEARQWYGDRFYKTAPRFHLEPTTDVNVPIPKELRTDLPLDTSSAAPRYPITAYATATSTNTPFTYSTTLAPSTSIEYAFSEGTPYTPSASERVTPTPFFITFGAVLAASEATVVHFLRRRELKFNGVRRGITGANLRVLVNDALVSQNTTGGTGTYGSYYLYKTPSDAPTLNAIDEVKYVSFEGGSPLGVPTLSLVQLVNVERTHIGSAATQTYWQLQGGNFDGAYIPAYGIGDLADYYRGYYPTCASLFKTRLALGGMRHQPQAVLVSAVFDTRSATPYMHFQISDDNVLASDALDIRLPAISDDRITALVTWQDSSFALTTQGAYRISSGDSPVLSRDTTQVSLMTRVGCINPFCVATTETGVYYLSQSGLFSLTARDNLKDQYDAVSASLKINNIWNVLKYNNSAAWIAYDDNLKLMYVGLPEFNLPQDYALKILAFHVQLGQWTEVYTHAHFRIYHAVFHDGRFTFAAATQNNLVKEPTNFLLAYFGDKTYNLDFVDVGTVADGNSPVYSMAPYPMVVHTLSTGLQEYATEGYKTGQLSGFRLSPLRTLRDVRAFVNGVELVFGDSYNTPGAQFIKLPNGNIYLLNNPVNGQTLTIIPRMVL